MASLHESLNNRIGGKKLYSAYLSKAKNPKFYKVQKTHLLQGRQKKTFDIVCLLRAIFGYSSFSNHRNSTTMPVGLFNRIG